MLQHGPHTIFVYRMIDFFRSYIQHHKLWPGVKEINIGFLVKRPCDERFWTCSALISASWSLRKQVDVLGQQIGFARYSNIQQNEHIHKFISRIWLISMSTLLSIIGACHYNSLTSCKKKVFPVSCLEISKFVAQSLQVTLRLQGE